MLSLLQKGDVRFGHELWVEQSLWGYQKRPQQKSKEAINGTRVNCLQIKSKRWTKGKQMLVERIYGVMIGKQREVYSGSFSFLDLHKLTARSW